MAAEQKRFMFFFRHFEKIICAMVVLALVGAVVHVIRKNTGDEVERVIDDIEGYVEELETPDPLPTLEEPPPYYDQWARTYDVPPSPDEIKGVFWMHYPQYYQELAVGTGREIVLEFDDPLDEGTVNVVVEEGQNVLSEEEKFVHPVNDDYSKVVVYTGQDEGTVRITAIGGGRAHVWEIRTDAGIEMQPHPPVDPGHVVTRREVEIHFAPNPDNREKVTVEAYEIHRRRARDLLDEFERVAAIPVSSEELTPQSLEKLGEEGRRTLEEGEAEPADGGGEPAEGNGEPPPEERAVGARMEDGVYKWRARRFDPDEIYLYKIRTVGLLSEPKESEFVRMPEPVRTMPLADFRLVFGMPEWVDVYELSLELAAEVEGGFEKGERAYVIGDRVTGEDGRFDTGSVLLDYHREPRRDLRRIVYVDRRGEIKSRRKYFWGTGRDGSEPWEVQVDENEAEEERDEDAEMLEPL